MSAKWILFFFIIPSLLRTQVVIPNDSVLIQDWLDAHNIWRAEVGVSPLKWNSALAKSSEIWAIQLSKKYGQLVHSTTENGENIFWSSEMTTLPSLATDGWGSEKKYYDGQKISKRNYQQFGHYTQMIWLETMEVGCAIVSKSGNGTYVVCQYYPAGNIIGEHPYKK